MRNLIGVVSQEPVLFNCTIEENIKYGNESVSDIEMVIACRMANAENFINQLPEVLIFYFSPFLLKPILGL